MWLILAWCLPSSFILSTIFARRTSLTCVFVLPLLYPNRWNVPFHKWVAAYCPSSFSLLISSTGVVMKSTGWNTLRYIFFLAFGVQFSMPCVLMSFSWLNLSLRWVLCGILKH